MEQRAKAADLLSWYDRHAREMPWRVAPDKRSAGVAPDPYKVWLSEIMLQQTTVAAVTEYFRKFTIRWPSVQALAQARDEDVMAAWAGLGYYARARNLLKCAREICSEHGGSFPADRKQLQELPGIGPYTSAAIAAIAFDQPETVVDGNVERVMARLHNVETPLPTAKPKLTELAASLTPQDRPGDYAQAVMDLGATICTPRNPACSICPWREPCQARALGTAATLPRKLPKSEKPIRHGIAYVVRDQNGAVLLERREPSGLLGGMLGFPTTEWTTSSPITPAPPVAATWEECNMDVRHTFTHFHLRLSVRLARVEDGSQPDRGSFIARGDYRPADLPTLMRKVHDVAKDHLVPD